MKPHLSPPQCRSLGPHRPARLSALLALLALGLAACSDDHAELDAWMAAQHATLPRTVEPFLPPPPFEPQAYQPGERVDPYQPSRLAGVLPRAEARPDTLLAAELKRPRQPLEDVPLDQMVMVGTLVRAARPQALLKVGPALFRVKVGDYLGPHYGRITAIAESGLDLREIVQDAAGDWVARPARLELQGQALTGAKDSR